MLNLSEVEISYWYVIVEKTEIAARENFYVHLLSCALKVKEITGNEF